MNRLLLIPFFCLVLAHMVQAQPPAPVGTVLMTRGHVQARDVNGNFRDLGRRSEIFPGDRLITGSNGFAQLRMIDTAVISLRDNTEFSFHVYIHDGDPATPDRAIMELHAGGLRTIDGLIGSKPGDVYRLVTPDTDVKPDGTTFECSIDNGVTFCGVSDGTITMANQADSLKLGLGADGDYGSVADRQSPHQLLLSTPPPLSNTNFQPPGLTSNPAQASNQNPTPVIPTGPATVGVQPATGTVVFPAPAPINVAPYKLP